MFDARRKSVADNLCHISPSASAPPVPIPPDHVGPVVLSGTGRLVWWTGRVAIGLRHVPEQRQQTGTQSMLWLQKLMLDKRRHIVEGSPQ
jgi:hypothetical protein